VDPGEGAFDLGRDGPRGRHRTNRAPLRRPLDRRHRADAKAKLVDLDAARPQALAQLDGEHRELVGPHAARYPEDEDPGSEGDGRRALGDARAHGLAPHTRSHRGPHPGEPVLARAVEDPLDALGSGERWAARSSHRNAIGSLTPQR
jgi:hypothetical protein